MNDVVSAIDSRCSFSRSALPICTLTFSKCSISAASCPSRRRDAASVARSSAWRLSADIIGDENFALNGVVVSGAAGHGDGVSATSRFLAFASPFWVLGLAVEAIVSASVIGFLARVRPELLP